MSDFNVEGLSALPDLLLRPEDLMGRVWWFGGLNGGPFARHVRLLPDGRVAGQLGENESFWRVENNRLIILDEFDRPSTVLDRGYADGDGRLSLVGRFQAPGGGEHLLREVAPVAGLAEHPPQSPLMQRRRAPRRRNLVILRANERSLHLHWPREMEEADRSWDLCVSFYGEERNFQADPWSEYQIIQNRQRKFEALWDLLHEGSPLWDYDYIALPDDDLIVSWRDWNRLFAACRDHRLELAQPALTHAGHINHAITGQDPRYLLRFVSFVEAMTPIFSRDALRACAPTFKGSVSGFGLDHVWPKLLGKPRDRIAIMDETPVLHTRPMARGFDLEGALHEGRALQDRYDAPSYVVEYGGVLAQPIDRTPTSP